MFRSKLSKAFLIAGEVTPENPVLTDDEAAPGAPPPPVTTGLPPLSEDRICDHESADGTPNPAEGVPETDSLAPVMMSLISALLAESRYPCA